MEVVLVIAVVVVIASIIVSISKANAIEAARKAYLEALAALKSDPANSDKRQRALALGRNYSNLARNSKGQTTFDEVALMNDIGAACAATSQVLAPKVVDDTEARLAKLHALRDKGLITADDFETRKAAILSEI